MKTKFILFAVVCLFTTNLGFASFPVQKKETTEMISSSQSNSEAQVLMNQDQTSEVVSAEETYTSPATNEGKSQLIALILVILVGGLGIHRFYLGYTWQGVVQLLTLGGCGIWTLIDLIRIITGDLKPKDGEYTTKL